MIDYEIIGREIIIWGRWDKMVVSVNNSRIGGRKN